MFKDSLCRKYLTNLDAKGAKRSIKMWSTNFYKISFKNILPYMNSRLSKIRSVHTYVMPRTVYFGLICISESGLRSGVSGTENAEHLFGNFSGFFVFFKQDIVYW